MHRNSTSGVMAILLASTAPLHAQTDPIALAPIVVDAEDGLVAQTLTTGGKVATSILDTAASVSVVTATEMRQRGAQTVEQVLQYSAGVSSNYYGSDDRFDYFQIRGFDAYTYRDGLSLGRNFGALREDPFAYDAVEIIRGGNSTLFGVSDPGGSVNYVSKLPRDYRFGEVYVTGGSFDHKEVGFDFGDTLSADSTLSFRLTGKVQDGDMEYDHSRDDSTLLMGGLTWRPTGATSISLVADYLKRDSVPGGGGHPLGTDFDRDVFFGEPDFNYRGTERTSLSLLADHDFGGGLSLSSNARYSSTKTDFGYAYIAGIEDQTATIADRDFFANDVSGESFIADAKLAYDRSFGTVQSHTLAGVEVGRSTNDNATYYQADAPGIDWTNPVYSGAPGDLPLIQDQRRNQRTRAIFVQQDLTFDRFIASVGVRHDWLDIDTLNKLTGVTTTGDFSVTTTRLGLTYKVTPDVSVYGSYAESVVPASNVSLDPERGEQFEIGAKYSPAGSRALFSAAIYDLSKTNITRTNPDTLLDETIGEIRVRGVDLEAKAELTDAFSLTAAYSHLDTEVVENGTLGNEGNRINLVPKNIGSVWAHYALEEMSFGLGARYTGSFWNDLANTQKVDNAVVFDAAYTWQVQPGTELAINVSNLFDEKHATAGGGAVFYNPGREVLATVRRTW